MAQCTFLSNGRNVVQCFNECVFYNWEDNGGLCPFKNLTGRKIKNDNDFYEYDLIGLDGFNEADNIF